MEVIPLLLLVFVCCALLFGYPVAFTLSGVSILFAIICIPFGIFDISIFKSIPLRIFGIMNNVTLLAVPLFIFMGTVLEKSGIASKMLKNMALAFRNIRGGLSLFYGSNENPDPNIVVDVISIEQEILHAFPNPFEKDISINDIDEINNIQLIDISGRIFQFEIENQLSTSHINAGFYILNVEYKNGKVLRKKMIKY